MWSVKTYHPFSIEELKLIESSLVYDITSHKIKLLNGEIDGDEAKEVQEELIKKVLVRTKLIEELANLEFQEYQREKLGIKKEGE